MLYSKTPRVWVYHIHAEAHPKIVAATFRVRFIFSQSYSITSNLNLYDAPQMLLKHGIYQP